MFWVFGPEACGISAPQLGVKPTPVVLEGEVLTTGPRGMSPLFFSAAAATAKSLESCLTLCDPIDDSLPGSSLHGVFQAIVLE